MNSISAESRGVLDFLASQSLLDLVDLGDLLALSLPVKDVFRAISVRVCSLLDCGETRLFLLEADRKELYLAGVWKEPAAVEREDIENLASELSTQCLSSKRIVISLETDGDAGCEVAIPLFRGPEVLGVLELRFPARPALLDQMEADCKAISEIVSPALVNSLIFERNQTATFSDLTTELPNKRAFEIAVENRIGAAYQDRRRGQGVVLAIDIAGFAGINQTVGFRRGDEVLCRVVSILRRSLRKMDLLARSHDDEFLVLLPDAAETETLNVISRVEHQVGQERLKHGGAPIRVKLNFGWAVLGKDGETVDSLLASARIRKNSSKAGPGDRKVLLFPRVK